MVEVVVARLGLDLDTDYFYFVDEEGDVSKTKRSVGRFRGGGKEKVATIGLEHRKGWSYFVNGDGDVVREKQWGGWY